MTTAAARGATISPLFWYTKPLACRQADQIQLSSFVYASCNDDKDKAETAIFIGRASQACELQVWPVTDATVTSRRAKGRKESSKQASKQKREKTEKEAGEEEGRKERPITSSGEKWLDFQNV